MEHMYELKGTEAIISPSLIYYEEIIRENIKKTIRTAGSPERLWPHVRAINPWIWCGCRWSTA